MSFFEEELRKIVSLGVPFSDPKYAGGACYGRLDESLRLKLQFVTMDTFQKYEGIKATVINKNDGPVDSTVFLFRDVLGRTKDFNFYTDQQGPYVWTYNGKTEWYAYQPGKQDYSRLCDAISDYCGVFQVQEPEQGFRMDRQL